MLEETHVALSSVRVPKLVLLSFSTYQPFMVVGEEQSRYTPGLMPCSMAAVSVNALKLEPACLPDSLVAMLY